VYVVNDNISHSGPLTCWGNVNIILADGNEVKAFNLNFGEEETTSLS
jgi:hypothetical protein